MEKKRTAVLDYRLYKEAGVLSRKVIYSDNEEDPEFYLLDLSKDILEKVWDLVQKEGTFLGFEEYCLLKVTVNNIRAICSRIYKDGIKIFEKEAYDK